MKKNIAILLFIKLIVSIQSQMTVKERENLLKKYTKKIGKDFESVFNKPKSFYHDESRRTYDSSKIQNIIDKYNFPQNYDFFKETNCTPTIKDQDMCGSCWAFSSTTALAYRYHKLGIDVNLSPQYLLSCYLNDCHAGEYIINAQFALVTHGTVTEECFPYSSAEGEVSEECPSKCKNNDEFKIYYAKNAYSTQLDYHNGDYYDIVTLIMDQLVNYGPVVADITIYEDFEDLYFSNNCSEIYKYDGTSNNDGKHAIVITGYGYEDSRFYWIIQNSWGTNFCGTGLAKVEFGELGIEKVSFSEPYIPENNKTNSKTIDAKFTLKQDCSLEFNTGNEEIKESFKLYFQNVDDPDSEFYYQCSLSPVGNKSKNEGYCSYNFNNIFEKKGYFKYKNYSSIKNENEYNFDFSSLPRENQFYFYGIDYIDYIYEYDSYISEEGSGILLYYQSEDDLGLVSNIYPNENIEASLSNCTIIPLIINVNYTYIYCKLKKEEINYFENNEDLPLAYDIFCGVKELIDVVVHKLDKTKFPVFKVKYFVKPKVNDNRFTIVTNIEGSISEFNEETSFFIIIKTNNNEEAQYLDCKIPLPSKIQDNFEIFCENLDGFEKNIDSYDFYLTPYYFIESFVYPFEVFIMNDIKAINYDEYQNINNKNNTEEKNDTKDESKDETKDESKNSSFIKNPIFIASSISVILIFILIKLLHL